MQSANRSGMFARAAPSIGETGSDIGAVDIVETAPDRVVRDLTVKERDSDYGQRIVAPPTQGRLADAVGGADVSIGLSVPGILSAPGLERMRCDPVVFAVANPVPEIQPGEAADHVCVMATGRSDCPNQINNVRCFPRFSRGLLGSRARPANEEMKLAAARAIAGCVRRRGLSEEYIISSVFNRSVASAVADAIAREAHRTGTARGCRRAERLVVS